MTPAAFFKKYIPAAYWIETQWGIPAIVTLAQAAVESGWGTNSPGYNFFGYSWFPGNSGQRQLLKTKEYHTNANVKYPVIISITKLKTNYYQYVVRKYFKCYDNAIESFTDYAELISFDDRYADSFDYIDDPARFFAVIFNAGYATSTSYYQLVISVMQTLKKYM